MISYRFQKLEMSTVKPKVGRRNYVIYKTAEMFSFSCSPVQQAFCWFVL